MNITRNNPQLRAFGRSGVLSKPVHNLYTRRNKRLECRTSTWTPIVCNTIDFGLFSKLWAMILHTLGVQVGIKVSMEMRSYFQRGKLQSACTHGPHEHVCT